MYYAELRWRGTECVYRRCEFHSLVEAIDWLESERYNFREEFDGVIVDEYDQVEWTSE